MSIMIRTLLARLVALALPAVLLPSAAWAHGVKLEYQVTQAIQITAAYDTGEPMDNAQVVVFSPTDPSQPWLTGTTDQQGRFTFTPDSTQPGTWEVQVRQAGHGDILAIPIEGEAATPGSTTSGAVDTVTDAPATVAPAASGPSYTALQQGLLVGSVVWGCVGTAFFFARPKK